MKEINPDHLIRKGPVRNIEIVTLQHISDRELEAKMRVKDLITQGGFSNIYNADILIGNKNIPFILKEYNIKNITITREQAKIAFENYKKAKEAGLKVFNTFRIIKDSNKILMTNGSSSDVVCVSSNGLSKTTTLESFKHKKLENIENFDELVEGVLKEITKATSHELTFDDNSFLFLINTDKNTVDFVIGDMDFLREVTPEDLNEVNTYAENKREAYRALEDMITRNIQNPDELLKKLKEKFSVHY